MQIRLAKEKEVPQVRKWLVDTAKWINSKKIPQWERFLDYEATEVCLEDYYKNKLYVLVDDEGNLVGSLSYGNPEEIDWKLWQGDGYAYFIHRIVVAKEYRGMKYGEYMLNWAKKNASEENKEVRLNCVEHNEYLYNYYKSKSFKYCGCESGYHLFKA